MAIKVKRIKKFPINEEAIVSITEMGNTYEICWCEHKNNKSSITKIDKDHYMINDTGEIKDSKHITNRLESKDQLSQSFKRLRELINTNATDIKKCRWITLTYKEHITDTVQAYKDFDKFIKRFRYKYGDIEYINVCEPQGNGRWHFHCLIIFPKKAPYIPNEELEKIWNNGFTKIQQLKRNIDNLGAYLSAHITDLSEEDATGLGIKYNEENLKKIDEIDGKKLKQSKYFIKGARLSLYPPNFRLYRTSRGIKKPNKEYMTYKEAKEKIGMTQPTYSKSIQLTAIDGQFDSKIVYEHYNTKRNKYSKKTSESESKIRNNDSTTICGIFLSIKDLMSNLYSKINTKISLLYINFILYITNNKK